MPTNQDELLFGIHPGGITGDDTGGLATDDYTPETRVRHLPRAHR